MQIPWLRSNFLARRRLDRLFLDIPDVFLRKMTGHGPEPPYSLRAFVGGAGDFDKVGRGFVQDLKQLNLISAGCRILDIGCGCGRLARPLAADPDLKRMEIAYTGMDVDRECIDWCRRYIRDPRFSFYYADCYNASYNREGAIAARSFRFSHPDEAFDLILLTSVLTHLVTDELEQYLSEVARLLAPDGAAYCSLFLLRPESEKVRSSLSFPVRYGGCAIQLRDFPANAVAYSEEFFAGAIARAGLTLAGSVRHELQDVAILVRPWNPSNEVQLEQGWHQLEAECWRWTEQAFKVRFLRGPSEDSILRFKFVIPEALLASRRPLRIAATAGSVPLEPCEYAAPGSQVYIRRIPARAFLNETPEVRFELNSALRSSPDERELGVQAAFWTCLNGARRPANPVSLLPNK